MSRYFLDDDDILVVNRTLAKAIGLNASIVLRQIHYWVKENRKKKSGKHFHDGCWWTFNTYTEWTEGNFEFWSYDTVRRTLLHLEKLGLVFIGYYNERKGDQTKWYTINFGAYDAFVRLWTERGSPRAGDSRPSELYKNFLEEWHKQRVNYTNIASCIDQYGNLQTPTVQVAMSVTRDYTETSTESDPAPTQERESSPLPPHIGMEQDGTPTHMRRFEKQNAGSDWQQKVNRATQLEMTPVWKAFAAAWTRAPYCDPTMVDITEITVQQIQADIDRGDYTLQDVTELVRGKLNKLKQKKNANTYRITFVRSDMDGYLEYKASQARNKVITLTTPPVTYDAEPIGITAFVRDMPDAEEKPDVA